MGHNTVSNAQESDDSMKYTAVTKEERTSESEEKCRQLPRFEDQVGRRFSFGLLLESFRPKRSFLNINRCYCPLSSHGFLNLIKLLLKLVQKFLIPVSIVEDPRVRKIYDVGFSDFGGLTVIPATRILLLKP